MEDGVRANVRYIHPKWRERLASPEIYDWQSMLENTSQHTIRVVDARGRKTDLDSEGFTLQKLSPSGVNFRVNESVTRNYFAAVSELVGKLLHADHVFVSHHAIRWGKVTGLEGREGFVNAYSTFVHNDCPLGAPRCFFREILNNFSVSLDKSKNWDFVRVNTWQPLEFSVQQNPLTLIDTQTVAAKDLLECVYVEYIAGSKVSMPEASVTYSSSHRFYYYPQLTTDEVIVFKQLDTRPDRANMCMHTSFFDESAPLNAPPRQSIEVRLICCFQS